MKVSMKEKCEIYFELFREVEKAIRILGEAQERAEALYLQSEKSSELSAE